MLQSMGSQRVGHDLVTELTDAFGKKSISERSLSLKVFKKRTTAKNLLLTKFGFKTLH